MNGPAMVSCTCNICNEQLSHQNDTVSGTYSAMQGPQPMTSQTSVFEIYAARKEINVPEKSLFF
jgi:hypothetical protein